jgi:hypothetical protein
MQLCGREWPVGALQNGHHLSTPAGEADAGLEEPLLQLPSLN